MLERPTRARSSVPARKTRTAAPPAEANPIDTRYLRTLMGYNARRVALVAIEQFVQDMAVYPFKPVDFSVMCVIVDNPGVTSRQLCAALNILPPNLVGLIQSLEQRGLIERRPHPQDGRATGLHATAQGAQRMMEARRTADAVEDRLASRLSPRDRQKLLELLQAVYD
ncbi:MAG: winged helix-turn-helix transcriptional regulator [Rhodoferax sp.]|nr:winged helix-turn-helix transcriptional regulator [Rhodoferax sp.]